MTDITGADALMAFDVPTGDHPFPVYRGRTADGVTPEIPRWLQQHVPVSTTSLAMAFLGEYTDAEREIIARTMDHYRTAEIQLNSQRITGQQWGANFLRNVARSPAWACQHEEPLKGQTVFVIGAGAALNDLLPMLPAVSRKAHVLCPNSALGALHAAGVEPDVVFYAEARDQSSQLREYAGATVLDVCASPAAWDAARHPLAACKPDIDLVRYLVELRVAPLRYAVSACCGAIAQAFAWGAARVVLAGTSYCVFADGKVYADGSPFEDVRERIGADGLSHTEATSKQEQPGEVRMLPAIGGGEVPSAYRLADEVAWIERRGAELPMANVNRRGVRLANVPELALEDVLAELPDLTERHDFTARVPRIDASVLTAQIASGLMRYLADPTPNPPPGLLKFLARHALFLQKLAADEGQRRAMMQAAMVEGATAALEALDGDAARGAR